MPAARPSPGMSAAQIQAQARLRLLEAREDPTLELAPDKPLSSYQFDPAGYIQDKLRWTPWRGTPEMPGQMDVLDAYVAALRKQEEKWKYEQSLPYDTSIYIPGEVIKYRIRIEAGHTVGKTKLAAGIVNHFFDTCIPAIIYTFAPSWEQIHDLLWKEIKADRRHKDLPGRILDLGLVRSDNHFAKGRAANNVYGAGTERAQGQHGKYLMFVLDEAEGIPDFIYNAVQSMSSGGIVIVIMLANPRTRISQFHKQGALSSVKNFRISCLGHPNVMSGREIVPAAVRREYVNEMLEEHAEIVRAHDPDYNTFEVPWRPGIIFKPDNEFLFRVLGIAPTQTADNTLITIGRYEMAKAREIPDVRQGHMARLGVDVARYGRDNGTLYCRHGQRVYRVAQFHQLSTDEYVRAIVNECYRLHSNGVTDFGIRVDAGGGFGSGVIDRLKSFDFKSFRDTVAPPGAGRFSVQEVHFNGVPYEDNKYANLATEMYGVMADVLPGVTLIDPPDALEADLCERIYDWQVIRAESVKRLEAKDDFRNRIGRSPDDGDGCVLACAPDHFFGSGVPWNAEHLKALSSGRPV